MDSNTRNVWTLRPEPEAEALKSLGNYPELVAILLLNRGLTTAEEAERFLQPVYERDLHDPFLMLGMKEAVERINTAVKAGEKIIIFGDYDADGVPGTAVLYSFFKKIGHEAVDIYIPDRHNEAYGLNVAALENLAKDGANLIITVDCGISNVAEAKRVRELGMDLIITDHHLSPAILPEAVAILDNKQPGDTYPYNMLCGAAMAFKLVQALIKSGAYEIADGWEKWLLDLVGIATVSDMVPLDGENRALAYFGLKVLRRTRRAGLYALYKVLGLKPEYIAEDDIGFSIGPRLNSASRMAHASQAFHLLTTDNPVLAETLAKHLEDKNQERRESVEVILQTIEQRFGSCETAPAIIVAGAENWSLGVLGLTAARVVEKYKCPVFLWSKNGSGEIKGSCRSDGTVNVVELMAAAGGTEFFANFGGHTMAGGFSIPAEREQELLSKLEETLATMPRLETTVGYTVDAHLSLDDVTESTWRLVDRLAPFGINNPKPIFLFNNIELESVRGFGNGGIHLELTFKGKWGTVKAIGFFLCTPNERGEFDAFYGHRFKGVNLEKGQKINLLANIEKSYFRGRTELRLRIVDIQ